MSSTARERDFGIDIVKAVAILLITNSHFGGLWGSYGFMASGLSLEIYLTQVALINTSLNSLFPLNLFVMFGEIVLVSYVVRVLARFFVAVFNEDKNGRVNWRYIIALE